jgi:hypothetical protein
VWLDVLARSLSLEALVLESNGLGARLVVPLAAKEFPRDGPFSLRPPLPFCVTPTVGAAPGVGEDVACWRADEKEGVASPLAVGVVDEEGITALSSIPILGRIAITVGVDQRIQCKHEAKIPGLEAMPVGAPAFSEIKELSGLCRLEFNDSCWVGARLGNLCLVEGRQTLPSYCVRAALRTGHPSPPALAWPAPVCRRRVASRAVSLGYRGCAGRVRRPPAAAATSF